MLLVAGISKIVARSEFDRICSGPDLRPSGADHDVFGGAACMRSGNTRLARFGDYPIQVASRVRWLGAKSVAMYDAFADAIAGPSPARIN